MALPVILILISLTAIANENNNKDIPLNNDNDIPLGSDVSSARLTLITNACNLIYQIWKCGTTPEMDFPEFLAKCVEFFFYVSSPERQCEPTNRYFHKNRPGKMPNQGPTDSGKNPPAFVLSPNLTINQISNLLTLFITCFLTLGTVNLIIPIYNVEQKRLLENEEKGRYFSWW